MKHIITILITIIAASLYGQQAVSTTENGAMESMAAWTSGIINNTMSDTFRVNALIIDTAVVFYPGPHCATCMIGNGKPTPVAVARDIIVVSRYGRMVISGSHIYGSGHIDKLYYELSGLPIDERRIFLIKD